MMVYEIVFWALIIFSTYAYIGYPFLLLIASLFRKKPVNKNEQFTSTITFIVAAYNEENVLEEKIENLIAQHYEARIMEIIIASDGSSDSTNEIVRKYTEKNARVKLLDLPRLGKANALNKAAAIAEGDILIFTDANAILDPDAAHFLVMNFADEEVGCVAGNQHYSRGGKTSGASLGEMLYWRYDRWIKDLETKVGNAISADGALYAIRRKLFIPIADPSATDDFSISTRVVPQGYRLVYEPKASVVEATAGSSTREFKRKARIINRGLRSLFGLGRFLSPLNGGFYSVQLISHKLLRRLIPLVLPLILLLNVALWPAHIFYRLTLLTQLVLYILGLIGLVFRNTSLGRKRLFFIPYYFFQANAAAILGIFWFVKGQRISVWSPQREEVQ